MAFCFSERHIEEYFHEGITVFRGVLPTSLVRDLRRALEPGRAIAREVGGPQAQRLQPIGKYGDRLDLQPVRDYIELPELIDAYQRVLSPDHTAAGIDRMGVFYEPGERPWCTQWHRDITADSALMSQEEWAAIDRDARFYTQSNCALYTDVSTWYVPGSPARPNLQAELQAAAAAPDLEGLEEVEAERRCLAYAPGGATGPGAGRFRPLPAQRMAHRQLQPASPADHPARRLLAARDPRVV